MLVLVHDQTKGSTVLPRLVHGGDPPRGLHGAELAHTGEIVKGLGCSTARAPIRARVRTGRGRGADR